LRATFGVGPRELRRRGAGHRLPAPVGRIALRLPFRPPFDWDSLLAFLGARAIPGVERIESGTWARTVRGPAGPAAIRVRPLPGEPALVLELPAAAGPPLLDTVDRVRRLFDLDADPHAIAAHLGRDRLLAPLLARRPGLRLPGAWDPFETAVRAILGQQVTVAGATTLAGRLAAAHGEAIPPAGEPDRSAERGLVRLFPTPEALASLDEAGAGMPAARVRAIRALAAAVRAGHLDFAGDRAACRAALLALPGIGPWTADYLGMRVFADPDAFPAGDLGLRQALEDHVPRSPARAGARPLPSTALVEARAEPWRPYRAYAAMHLWAALASRRREGPARGPVPTAEAPRRRPPGRRASDPSRPDRRSPR
jgi:AraC family transcriptional regulator of adaptative response / DNA-3-methyladenine glycosylase II